MSEEISPESQKSTAARTFYWHLVPLRIVFRVISTIAPRLTGRLVLGLFRTPRRHRTPPREVEWLESGESFTIEAGGEQLAGWSWGSGPTVLLMHGWEGRASQMGAFVDPLVQAGFRAVAVDAPAHGRSTGKLSSMPQFATTIAALSDRFGPVHGVVAHSLGAAASSWAAKEGSQLPRMVFVAPPGDIDDYVVLFGEILNLSERSRREMVTYLERRFDIRWDDVRVVTLEPPEAKIALLIIHDETDQDSPIENGQRISSAWPHARMIATSGLGHRRILWDPEVVSQAVEFLQSELDQPADSDGQEQRSPLET